MKQQDFGGMAMYNIFELRASISGLINRITVNRDNNYDECKEREY